MESNTIFESAETFRKNVESTNDWYQKLNTSFFDTYNKQFGLTMDIYKKYLETMLSLSKGNMQNVQPYEIFKNNLSHFLENMGNTFKISKDILAQFSNYTLSGKGFDIWANQGKDIFENAFKTYQTQAELIWKFNLEYFEMSSKLLKGTSFDTKEITDKFYQNLKVVFEQASQQIMTCNEQFITQNHFTKDTFDKLNTEIISNLDRLLKEVVDFWSKLSVDAEKSVEMNAPSTISRVMEDTITQPKYNAPLKKKVTESVN